MKNFNFFQMRISPALEFESLSSVDFAGNPAIDSEIIEKIHFLISLKIFFIIKFIDYFQKLLKEAIIHTITFTSTFENLIFESTGDSSLDDEILKDLILYQLKSSALALLDTSDKNVNFRVLAVTKNRRRRRNTGMRNLIFNSQELFAHKSADHRAYCLFF